MDREKLSLLIVLAPILLAACGGGAGGTSGSSAPASSPVSSTGSSSGGTTDTTAPTVTITSPTTNATYGTGSATLNIGGSASDNVGVTQVTWSNSRSGSGTASGTTSWSANNITLQSGSNVITVTARDAAGNTASKTLTVTYSDTTPPTVSSISPSNGATNVSISPAITVTFSETMNASSITAGTFTVNGVTGSISVNGAGATFTPSSALASSTSYTVTIVGGSSGVKDAAGNPLASNYTWTFTTSAPIACGSATVLCVDDTAGPTQQYATIQAAVNVAIAGDTVLVYDGTYTGFVVSASGTSSNPIVIKAQGSSAVINQPNSRGEGITISNASYVTVEGFTITNIPGYGLASHDATPDSPMHGLVIRGNTVQNSGTGSTANSPNIYISEGADSLIENNIASGSVQSHGIYLANGGSDNTIVRGNRCFNNAKAGIHFNGDITVGGDGYETGLTIENNILYNNSGNGLNMDGVGDSTIRNNVIYNNSPHAMRAFQIDAAQGPRNLKIVNNTFVESNTGGGAVLKITEDQGGHTIFNNIMINDGSNGSIVVSNVNLKSNNNVVAGGFSLDGETTMLTLSQWQSSGYDANSVVSTSTVLFTNPGSADYTLKSGAPAANSGLASFNSVSAPTVDILGISRPQGGAYDIGAYESF
jgi:parallel beta-helix repeat protein